RGQARRPPPPGAPRAAVRRPPGGRLQPAPPDGPRVRVLGPRGVPDAGLGMELLRPRPRPPCPSLVGPRAGRTPRPDGGRAGGDRRPGPALGTVVRRRREGLLGVDAGETGVRGAVDGGRDRGLRAPRLRA